MELRKNYLKIQRRYDYSLELNFVGGGGKLIAFGDGSQGWQWDRKCSMHAIQRTSKPAGTSHQKGSRVDFCQFY